MARHPSTSPEAEQEVPEQFAFFYHKALFSQLDLNFSILWGKDVSNTPLLFTEDLLNKSFC
jgi:hypothetical protein